MATNADWQKFIKSGLEKTGADMSGYNMPDHEAEGIYQSVIGPARGLAASPVPSSGGISISRGSLPGGAGGNQGGIDVSGYQEGGEIPGHGEGDKVPIKAEPGEYVIPKDVVHHYGTSFFQNLMNKARAQKEPAKTKYQDGGEVLDEGYSAAPKEKGLDTLPAHSRGTGGTSYGAERSQGGITFNDFANRAYKSPEERERIDSKVIGAMNRNVPVVPSFDEQKVLTHTTPQQTTAWGGIPTLDTLPSHTQRNAGAWGGVETPSAAPAAPKVKAAPVKQQRTPKAIDMAKGPGGVYEKTETGNAGAPAAAPPSRIDIANKTSFTNEDIAPQKTTGAWNPNTGGGSEEARQELLKNNAAVDAQNAQFYEKNDREQAMKEIRDNLQRVLNGQIKGPQAQDIIRAATAWGGIENSAATGNRQYGIDLERLNLDRTKAANEAEFDKSRQQYYSAEAAKTLKEMSGMLSKKEQMAILSDDKDNANATRFVDSQIQANAKAEKPDPDFDPNRAYFEFLRNEKASRGEDTTGIDKVLAAMPKPLAKPPTGSKPLNKTLGGKPAYVLPDGKIWVPD